MRLGHAACSIVFVLGCGVDYAPHASNPDLLSNLTVPPAPAPDKGFQVITPIFDNVEAGMDYEVCTWTDVITDHDIDVRSTLGYQAEPPGHHIIVFYTMVHQAPTTRVCQDADMATFRFLAGAGNNGELNEAPGNLVYHVPAGAQIVINHHYLNSTDKPLRGQSAVNVNYADPNGTYVHNGYLAVLDSNLMIAEGQYSLDITATVDRTYKVWDMIPHMHQWGQHAVVKVTQSGHAQTLFDVDWDPSYAFHPPDMRLDPANPMLLNPGDTIDINCEWNNTAGKVLTFGFEMCVAFANFVDDTDQGSWAWDNGWSPL